MASTFVIGMLLLGALAGPALFFAAFLYLMIWNRPEVFFSYDFDAIKKICDSVTPRRLYGIAAAYLALVAGMTYLSVSLGQPWGDYVAIATMFAMMIGAVALGAMYAEREYCKGCYC